MGRWTQEVRLLGASSLEEYVDYVRDETRGGRDIPDERLVDEWRAASRLYAELAAVEGGLADEPEVLPLPGEIGAWVEQLVAMPHFRRNYDMVPISLGLVELDRLTLIQHDVCVDHVPRIRNRLGDAADPLALARLCLPHETLVNDVSITRVGDNRFVVQSRSMDMRFLGAQILRADEVSGPAFPGTVAGIIGLAVGFSTNCVSVVRYGKRMVLHNGYHRAYALRSMGVTHVPCVIEVCGNDHDVELAGGSRVSECFERSGEAPRPPLFKDFFDARLTRRFRAALSRKQVQFAVDVQAFTVHE